MLCSIIASKSSVMMMVTIRFGIIKMLRFILNVETDLLILINSLSSCFVDD